MTRKVRLKDEDIMIMETLIALVLHRDNFLDVIDIAAEDLNEVVQRIKKDRRR